MKNIGRKEDCHDVGEWGGRALHFCRPAATSNRYDIHWLVDALLSLNGPAYWHSDVQMEPVIGRERRQPQRERKINCRRQMKH